MILLAVWHWLMPYYDAARQGTQVKAGDVSFLQLDV